MSEDKKPRKKFSKKQLRASQGILPMMAKTNIYASQAGTTCFGAVRHGSDIKADDLNQDGHGILTQQAKTNIYASQAGMRGFGAVRHGSDIRADDANQDGHGILTQQAKTNVYANQSGMTCFGAVRHGFDIKVTELYNEGGDDEYPTDDEEPTPVVSKPSRRVRDVPNEETNETPVEQADGEEPVPEEPTE